MSTWPSATLNVRSGLAWRGDLIRNVWLPRLDRELDCCGWGNRTDNIAVYNDREILIAFDYGSRPAPLPFHPHYRCCHIDSSI